MKNKLLVFFVMVLMSACSTNNVDIHKTDIEIRGISIKVYVMDSCEYVGNVVGSRGDFITHKGNCKFCIKRGKK